MWWIAAGVVAAGAVAWGAIVSDVEQAPYTVVQTQGNFETRDYPPLLVAETEASGDRKEAIRHGFRTLADYIFGHNTVKERVGMTAPVLQEAAGTGWTVRFVMPARYTPETLPTPDNPAVKTHLLPAARFVAVRFSGTAGDESLQERTQELDAFVAEHKLQALSPPMYAFFNPPWTLPFLRRNEVLREIAK